MKAVVDEDLCTGCGLCADTCPDVFEMADDLAKVKGETVPESAETACKEAIEGCPVEAITSEG